MGFSELHVRTFNCGCVCNTHTRSLDLFHDLVVSEEVQAAAEIRGGSGALYQKQHCHHQCDPVLR